MTKTCLITGAAGGLGQAVTQKFLAEGYQVVATLGPHDSLPAHERLVCQTVDVTNEAACAQLVADTVARFGQIDAGLLLVGGFAMGRVSETGGAELEKMFAINFQTAYFMARPLFAQMMTQAGGGQIVLVGARPALLPAVGKDMMAYSLSKSLIFHLAELLNAAGKAHGVRATVVVPSTIDTPANRAAMPDAHFADWASPASIAELMALACSPTGAPLRETVLKVYNNA
jgi:NAD(P)-dependent dehydrogenase (short-subunit alcohol dehydrogenase family)